MKRALYKKILMATMLTATFLPCNAADVSAIETAEKEIYTMLYGGHAYRYIPEEMSWSDAKAYCEEVGGHMVTFSSQAENDAVFSYLKEIGCKESQDIYIGISDMHQEGDWSAWVTGEAVTYTNWGKSQPDNMNDEQDYGVICMGERDGGSQYYMAPGQWDDIHAAQTTFICEWDTESYASIPKDVMIYNGHSYKMFSETMTWEDAKAYCELRGGHLAAITSKNENTAIFEYLEERTTETDDIYIGISDKDSEGDWTTWVTGEKVTYKNWGKNEPDDFYGGQDYGVICMGIRDGGSAYYVKPKQWDDIGSGSRKFLCEWDTVNDNLAKGTTFIDSKTGAEYKITTANSTVQYAAAFPSNAKQVKIADTVRLKGITYKVTSVKNSALKGNKKLTKVTIGKNITEIGKNAFNNCKTLKNITIKTTTLKKVGKNAFKNISEKAKIKVPKKQLKKYQKLMKKSGISKKVKIK